MTLTSSKKSEQFCSKLEIFEDRRLKHSTYKVIPDLIACLRISLQFPTYIRPNFLTPVLIEYNTNCATSAT